MTETTSTRQQERAKAEQRATAPATPVEPKAAWHKPKPIVLPRPTYWPAVLAFGIVFVLWGLVASPILSGTGVVIAVIGLIGWIRELLQEPPEEEEPDARS